MSVDSSGVEGDWPSIRRPAVSVDGLVVAFESAATNLVAGDTNWYVDIYVHDRTTRMTERVSVSSAGFERDQPSFAPAISADGQVVAFHSVGTFGDGLADTNYKNDVFVRDRTTGITWRVSLDSSGAQANGGSTFPALSADGQIVAFESDAYNLVAGDTNGAKDIFVHDRTNGITERVSVDSSGSQANGASYLPALSADGQIVVFSSDARNLVAGDGNSKRDIFVHDRTTGITERVSVDSSGSQANDSSDVPALSADGLVVAFESDAFNLVAGDTNDAEDIFVHDRTARITERVSVNSSGAESNCFWDAYFGYCHGSYAPALSADGAVVAFHSYADNLVAGDTNDFPDVFRHDRTTGITGRVSVDSSGAEANGTYYCSYGCYWLGSFSPAISADGLALAFASYADNLVAGDTNGSEDIFVRELCRSDATWSNYGAGYPGTLGIPSFTSRADPVLGTTLTLDLANSYGRFTTGMLFFGLQWRVIHSSWGGDLWVIPDLIYVIALAPAGTSFTAEIPHSEAFCGLAVYSQAIELDPGALKGVSFTEGLKLVLGH